MRADHEYHILVLIGIVQTKILPESSYTITLPYLNSGRIALRSFLNKWDMRRLSNYFSIVLLSISILLYFLVAKFDEYVLETSFYLFKTDLSETIVFSLVIFAFSVWTSRTITIGTTNSGKNIFVLLRFFFFTDFVEHLGIIQCYRYRRYYDTILFFHWHYIE